MDLLEICGVPLSLSGKYRLWVQDERSANSMTMLNIPLTPMGESREQNQTILYEDLCSYIYREPQKSSRSNAQHDGNRSSHEAKAAPEESTSVGEPSDNRLIVALQANATHASQLQRDYVITRNLDLPILFKAFGFSHEPQMHFMLVDEGWLPLAHAVHDLSVSRFCAIALALIQGIQSLHDQHINHRALSLGCVWVHPQKSGIKLSNLGMAQFLAQPEALVFQNDILALITILQTLCNHVIAPHQQTLRAATGDAEQNTEFVTLQTLQQSLKKSQAHDSGVSLQALQTHIRQAAGEAPTAPESTAPAFTLPNKIYGREAEITTLLKTYEQVGESGTALVLLTGASGVGKTAVVDAMVQQLQPRWQTASKRTTTAQALSPWCPTTPLIRCKFEQFNPRIPLEAITAGMRHVLKELDFQDFEEALACADNPQTHRAELLMPWIQSMTSPSQPLILVLDDLHWADHASLDFMQRVANLGARAPVLVVGIYREQEVGPKHPLMTLVKQLQKQQISCQTLTLSPLPQECFDQWIQEVLGGDQATATRLAVLVEQQTQGNPFYIRQLLFALHRQGFFRYDSSNHDWHYDLAALEEQLTREDLVEFLARQLSALPETTQLALQLAACLGNQFQLKALADIYPLTESIAEPGSATVSGASTDDSLLDVEVTLWPAQQQGFVQCIDNDRYRFTHDRIQQAACLLLPRVNTEDNGKQNRWTIAQTLLSSLPMAGRDSQVFETIDQLDPAWHLVQNPERRAQLTLLNLVAGRRALVNQDYAAAIRYFTRGLEWLPNDAWENHYELTLDLHEAACAAEYRHTNFYRAASLTDVILDKAQGLQDQAKAYEIRIRLHAAAAQYEQAIDLGLNYLEQLGVSLGQRAQSPLSMAELEQLPMMTQRAHLLSLRLLSLLIFPCLHARPSLFPRLVGTMLQLTHQFGLSSYAAVAYSGLAVLRQDLVIAQQALWILEELNVQEMRGQVLLLITARVYVWQTPLHEIEDALAQIVQVALEAGELEVASQATVHYCSYQFLSGRSLTAIAEDYQLYQEMVETLQQSLPSSLNQIFHNLLNAFRRPKTTVQQHWWELPEPPQTAQANLDLPEKQSSPTPAATIPSVSAMASLAQGMLLFYGGHPRPALAALASAFSHQVGMVGLLSQAICNFYSALCLLSICDTVSSARQQTLLAQVDHLQGQLRERWQQAPTLFQHYDDLITAERSRVLRQWSEALDYYDRAIAGAKAQEHQQNLALAYELAAHFYGQWQKPQLAASHLRQAHRAYLDWGAVAKARALETRYPHLLRNPQADPSTAASQPLEAIQLTPIPDDSELQPTLDAILRLAQRLTPLTHEWDKLTVAILQGAAELVPAQRLLLVVQSPQQQQEPPRIRTRSRGTTAESFAQDLTAARPGVGNPEAITWQVALTGQRQRQGSLWIKRSPAPAPMLLQLPPILETTLSQGHSMREAPGAASPGDRPQPAILSIPLGNPTEPIALLYLESPTAFTAQHQQRIELLGQQAAITLAHARTQALLENTVEHRTQMMRQEIIERRTTEIQLEQQLKRARLLETITQQIRENLHPEEMFQAAAQAIGSAFQTSRCIIHRYSPNHEEAMLPLVAEYLASDYPSLQNNPFLLERNPYIQAMLEQSGAMVTSNVYTRSLDNQTRIFCLQTELKSLLAVKTSNKGEVNGIIALHQCDRFREWSQDEIDLLCTLADQVGIAQAQVQLLETEQQQRQALEKAKIQAEKTSQSKGQFIANLGHELRTPLNAILGFSRLMADAPETAGQHRPMLRTINDSGEHLLKLIEDVMAMAKLEAGRATLDVEDVDLVNLLRSIRDVFFLQTKIKGLSFTVERDNNVPRYIRTDGGKLRQVLMNLAGNAVKFTQQGSIAIRVQSEGQAQQLEAGNAPLEQLRFEVQDTGPGIPSEDIDRLFEDFEQTDVGRREKSGTGLGLSISRKLVELMGGNIAVTSNPAVHKTVFHFNILAECMAPPAHDRAPTPTLIPDEAAVPLSVRRRSGPLLTVEHLSVMSWDWIKRLEKTATLLDQEAVFQLLDEVPEEHRALGDSIAHIAHQFGYETLIELAQTYLANHPDAYRPA